LDIGELFVQDLNIKGTSLLRTLPKGEEIGAECFGPTQHHVLMHLVSMPSTGD